MQMFHELSWKILFKFFCWSKTSNKDNLTPPSGKVNVFPMHCFQNITHFLVYLLYLNRVSQTARKTAQIVRVHWTPTFWASCLKLWVLDLYCQIFIRLTWTTCSFTQISLTFEIHQTTQNCRHRFVLSFSSIIAQLKLNPIYPQLWLKSHVFTCSLSVISAPFIQGRNAYPIFSGQSISNKMKQRRSRDKKNW